MKHIFLLLVMLPFSAQSAPYGNNLGDLHSRITRLEEHTRLLNGKIEELEYKLEKLNDKTLKPQKETISDTKQKPIDTTPKSESKPNTEVEEFKRVFAKLEDDEISAAEQGFELFVSKYPKTELSGEAYYWLGEIAFEEQDYNRAAINYLKGYKDYPKGVRAPENVLRLAETLNKLGKPDEACRNLGRFNIEFKKAHPNLIKHANETKKELGCQ